VSQRPPAATEAALVGSPPVGAAEHRALPRWRRNAVAHGWFRLIRQQRVVPLAMGELFTHPLEWQPLLTERLADIVRVHLSQERARRGTARATCRRLVMPPMCISTFACPILASKSARGGRSGQPPYFPGFPRLPATPIPVTDPGGGWILTKSKPPNIRRAGKIPDGPKRACRTARSRGPEEGGEGCRCT